MNGVDGGWESSKCVVQEDIVKAMGLTGQLLMGQAVMVKSSEVHFPTFPSPNSFGQQPACFYCCDVANACLCLSLQAEKNLAWEAAQAQAASVAQLNSMQSAGGPCKLLVSNLHPNIAVSYILYHSKEQLRMEEGDCRFGYCRSTGAQDWLWVQENDLRQIFEPFGPIESVSIQREGGSRPQNFGFVQ